MFGEYIKIQKQRCNALVHSRHGGSLFQCRVLQKIPQAEENGEESPLVPFSQTLRDNSTSFVVGDVLFHLCLEVERSYGGLVAPGAFRFRVNICVNQRSDMCSGSRLGVREVVNDITRELKSVRSCLHVVCDSH